MAIFNSELLVYQRLHTPFALDTSNVSTPLHAPHCAPGKTRSWLRRVSFPSDAKLGPSKTIGTPVRKL